MTAFIAAAFGGYWTEIRSGRLKFWTKEPVALGVEFINGPIVLFFLSLARARFGGLPDASGFSMLVAGTTAVIAFVAGGACLALPLAREPFTENMRKFLAVAWIALSAAAIFVSADYFIPWIPFFQEQFGRVLDEPDLWGVIVPSSVFALAIIATQEALFGTRTTISQSAAGAAALLLGVGSGAVVFLGLPV